MKTSDVVWYLCLLIILGFILQGKFNDLTDENKKLKAENAKFKQSAKQHTPGDGSNFTEIFNAKITKKQMVTTPWQTYFYIEAEHNGQQRGFLTSLACINGMVKVGKEYQLTVCNADDNEDYIQQVNGIPKNP